MLNLNSVKRVVYPLASILLAGTFVVLALQLLSVAIDPIEYMLARILSGICVVVVALMLYNELIPRAVDLITTNIYPGNKVIDR